MDQTIVFGTCGCGASGQLFKTGTCAHCRIKELEEGLAELAAGGIRALRLEPGDIVIYRTDEQFSEEQRVGVTEILEREFAGNRVLVVDCGAELQAIRPTAAASEEERRAWRK